MSHWDEANGCTLPGKNGSAVHRGKPLSVDQIRALPEGAEVVVTWSGGNGPHLYRVAIDAFGERCVNGFIDPLLRWAGQKVPLNRVTLAALGGEQ